MEDFFAIIDRLDADMKLLILIGIIIAGAIFFTRLFRWMIERVFSSGIDQSPADITRLTFLKNASTLIIWLVALGGIIYTIPKLRSIAVTIFAGAGILVVVIGLAAQQAFSNIIGGIFIVIFKPFRVGDMIKVGAYDYGFVEDITLRHTVIRSWQNKRIVIPNAIMSSETIMNDTLTDPRICRWFEVGISYDSDIDKAIRIIQEEAMKHPNCIDNRSEEEVKEGAPQVVVRVVKLNEYSVDLRAWIWAEDSMKGVVMSQELNKLVKQRFDREGIEIPFPYRTIVYKKDIVKD